MAAWLARSLAEQGQYAAAEQCLADPMRHPHISPVTRVAVLAVAGVLAARRGDATSALDEALPLAVHTGESQWLVPVAAARAEAAWIAGRRPDIVADIDRAWPVARAHPQPWDLGELGWWLQLAGDRRQISAPLAPPFALMLARPARGRPRSAGRRDRHGRPRPPMNGVPWAARCGRPTRLPSPRRRGMCRNA